MNELFYFTSGLALLFLCLCARRISPYLFALVSLPATSAHEAAHWVAAIATGSSCTFPNLWPRKAPGTEDVVLGSVDFTPNLFNAAFVALAPLLNIVLAYFTWHLSQQAQSLGCAASLGVICGYLLMGGVPSRTDWVVALKSPVSFIIILGLAALAVYASIPANLQ